MLDRWLNIFFSLALIFVFILFGNSQDHQQIIIGIILATLLSAMAFILNWLTIDGTVAAGVFGSIAYGLGGILGAAIILGFFISGSLLSKDLISKEGFLEMKFRRNGIQVWSNGFWFTLWVLVWFLAETDIFLIAAITSISFAAADTWATEIGFNHFKAKTRLITTWKKVEPGTDGGVSFYGTLAAMGGAMFIGAIFYLLYQESTFFMALLIVLAGFTGNILDSIAGAQFQERRYNIPGGSVIGMEEVYINNNFVNWISAGIASLISLVLILIVNL